MVTVLSAAPVFSRLRCGAAAVALATLVAAAGCGDDYGGRKAVSGTVTVKGEPLGAASITFEPAEGQDTRGGCGVKDGKYEIPRDAGLKPGKYLVRLTAGDGMTPANADPDAEAGGPGGNTNIVSVDLIPPEYGVRSTQTVTVTADGPNQFDFDLPALVKPKPRKKR